MHYAFAYTYLPLGCWWRYNTATTVSVGQTFAISAVAAVHTRSYLTNRHPQSGSICPQEYHFGKYGSDHRPVDLLGRPGLHRPQGESSYETISQAFHIKDRWTAYHPVSLATKP